MSAEEFKAEGNKHFAAKAYEQAIESFTKAIEASAEPNHVLYSNRSASYASLKNFGQALKDAQEVVKINSSWAKGYNRVGAAEYGLGNLEEAKQAYSKAIELDGNNAMAKEGLESVNSSIEYRDNQPDMGLGLMFADPNIITNLKNNPKTAKLMKDPELVAKILQIQQNPKANATQFLSDPRLMTIMASLMGIDLDNLPDKPPSNIPDTRGPAPDFKPKDEEKKSKVEEKKAEEKSKPKHVDDDPEDVVMEDVSEKVNNKSQADAAKAEGNTLYKQRKFDEAIIAYNKAWELHQDITYLNNRSAAEYEKNDYDAAIKTCEEAIEQGRELRQDYKLVAKAFARLGNTYLKKDDLENAVKAFDKSLTEHRTPDILNKLRATQKQIKERDAKAYINPELAEAARLEGKEFFTKADWPAAVKSYTEMIQRAPEDARGYSNRAAALAKLLSFPDAVEDCNKAISKDPEFIRAYIRKANCLLAMKEYSQVIETLNDAREKDLTLGGKNISEIDQLYNKAASQRFSAIEGETSEQTMERVSKDPEIVSILQDPVMQGILGQARDNPAALQDHMKNPEVGKKINMLIAAGVIRTR